MPFQDIPLALPATVIGLEVSESGPMVLEVSAGSVFDHESGLSHVLASPQDCVLTSDATFATQVFVGLVSSEGVAEVWVDAFLKNGETVQADPPEGYKLVAALAWFVLAPGEVDLSSVQVSRRVWL